MNITRFQREACGCVLLEFQPDLNSRYDKVTVGNINSLTRRKVTLQDLDCSYDWKTVTASYIYRDMSGSAGEQTLTYTLNEQDRQ